jgi:hypothetical protein
MCNLRQRRDSGEATVSADVSDCPTVRRLILQIERDVTKRASLALLLAAAESVLFSRRQELRTVRARLKRQEARLIR